MADRTFVFRVARVEDSFVGMGDDLRQVTAYRDLLWSTHLDNLQAIVRAYHEWDTGQYVVGPPHGRPGDLRTDYRRRP